MQPPLILTPLRTGGRDLPWGPDWAVPAPAAPSIHLVGDRGEAAAALAMTGFDIFTHPSALAFLDVARTAGPCCVVTALDMSGMGGLDLIRWLAQRRLKHPVIVLSRQADVSVVVAAIHAGARDFIETPLADGRLEQAVRAALHAQPSRDAAPPPQTLLMSLSPRERLVLRGVVDGHANKVIAQDLGISPRTVEAHRAHLMAKMGVKTRMDLVGVALLAGL